MLTYKLHSQRGTILIRFGLRVVTTDLLEIHMYCHGQCRVMYRFAGASLDRTRGCHRLLIESCFDSFCIPLSTTELVKERKMKNEKRKDKREKRRKRLPI